MSNINTIRLSGTTYQIEDSNAPKTVELTQAQYDALVDKDPNTFYVITDAEAGDLTNYYTKSETNTLLGDKADTATTYTKTEVDTALATKQDTLVSSVNIKTINNTSILGSGNIDIQGGGGGKAVTGGRNISVTTGETADTINCTLPMKAEVNNTSIYFSTDNWGSASGGRNLRIGYNANALGEDAICLATNSTTSGASSSIVGGRNHYIYNKYSFIGSGYMTNLYNMYEASVGGQYNNSVSASTTFGDSGNTLFSVGNGTADNARHNAFEIRQNGDIYISSGGTDILLQDHLGGGGGGKAVAAGTNISVTTGETADTINCTLPITATSSVFDTISVGANSGGGGYNTMIGPNAKCDNSSRYNVFLIAQRSNNSSTGSYVKGSNNVIIGSMKDGYTSWDIPSFSTSQSVVIGGGEMSTDKNNSLAIGYNANVSGTTKTNINNQLKIDTSNQVYIYNKDNTEMICLQDHLGGGGSSYSAGTGIDITNDVISVTGMVATSAITTSITSSSTDAQVPSAKAVYDIVGNIETLLSQI